MNSIGFQVVSGAETFLSLQPQECIPGFLVRLNYLNPNPGLHRSFPGKLHVLSHKRSFCPILTPTHCTTQEPISDQFSPCYCERLIASQLSMTLSAKCQSHQRILLPLDADSVVLAALRRPNTGHGSGSRSWEAAGVFALRSCFPEVLERKGEERLSVVVLSAVGGNIV